MVIVFVIVFISKGIEVFEVQIQSYSIPYDSKSVFEKWLPFKDK